MADVFAPPKGFAEKAHIKSFDEYKAMYERSVRDPEGFWAEYAKGFYWKEPWKKVREWDWSGDIRVKWFLGGKTNLSYNALDRHLETRGDQVALIWEGNEPGEDRKITYRELHAEVCRFANVLKSVGVEKGDRVSVYMPMVIELPVAILACARIGAVHSVVFGGFSPQSLADRIVDSGCRVLVTADGVYRGAKPIGLKENADKACELAATEGVTVGTCIVFRRHGDRIPVQMKPGRDRWWHDVMKDASPACEPEWVDAEDPLFILYTSGSTGKPKGVLHTTGGYMVHATTTFRYVFDWHDGDVYWCTADIGWVTGHSYIVYGPLCAGATSILFEGIPNHPDPGRFWDVVDKYRVTQFYTAPTAIRALMRHGDEPVKKRKLTSLRLLGSVGEPINPEAWRWYWEVVGQKRCPVVDTWWQTETGGIMITPLPGATPLKPGSGTLPFFGVKPVIVGPDGQRLEGNGVRGNLCIEEPWPGMLRTVYGRHERLRETYFSTYPGLYFTGDGAMRDEDGYYWILGRVDDVLNVSGHRIGTAEIESALVGHRSVAEAAVVGYPHDIKGTGIYAFVTVKEGVATDEALRKALVAQVREVIGAIAAPDVIHWANALPKTRSGKIMRRILRKIASGDLTDFGDTTTLADETVVKTLIDSRP